MAWERPGLLKISILARDQRRDTGSGGAGLDRGRFDGIDQIASIANRSFQGGC